MRLPYVEIQRDKEDPAIIYNETTKVDAAISDEWIAWMKADHIPEMIATGCFDDATILRLTEVDDSEGPTYAVQYAAQSKALYNRYIQSFSTAMQEKVQRKWGNLTVSFRTVLQVVN